MAGSSAPILLKTKLHRPTLQTDFVSRAHLVAKLQKGLDRKLALIVAPAGFGKSTLVASWLGLLEDANFAVDSIPLRTAWLSLDPQDDSLPRFLSYVVAAIHTAFAAACPSFERTIQSLPLPSVAYLADLLAAELGELAGKLVLAFDDFHQLQNADVQQFIERLLLNAPATLHLVIVSRVDPPLPLSRLRVQNQINEIRAADLRFSVEEAELFFTRALPDALPAELVRRLDERAEGWVAGLRLAAISLLDGADPEILAAEFGGTQRHVMDFLLEQVLALLQPEVVEFMLFTAPLEMLCVSLCDEVINAAGRPGRIDSRAVLDYLARSNLFLVPLDSKGHWYRYHHLFREMLVYSLETQHLPATVAAIRRQAAAWLDRNGQWDAAVRQLLEIEAEEEAADLIEGAIAPALGRESWPQVHQLLTALPDAVMGQRPVLLAAQAWLHSVTQRMDLMLNLLQRAEDLLHQQREAGGGRQPPPWLDGWIHALRCLAGLLRWDMEAATSHGQQALALIARDHVYARGITVAYYSMGVAGMGRYDEAVAICAEALVNEEDEDIVHRILSGFGMLAAYKGDLYDLAAAGERNLRVRDGWKTNKPHAWGYVYLGMVEYEQNNLEVAKQHFLAAYEDRFGGGAALGMDSCYGLGITALALGDDRGAHHWAGRMADVAQEVNNVYLMATAQWFACRLALAQGSVPPIPSAHLWCLGKSPGSQFRWGELPDLTYARLLIAQGTRASLAEVVERMQSLADFCARYNMEWRRIQALALVALAQAAQGHQEAALATLATAVKLAQPQPFTRTFVDFGPQMAGLLHKLAQTGVAAEYIGRILPAFPLPARNSLAVAAAQRDDEIIEPLSQREMEVLGLLAERLSDKEIADRLRISPLTVRRHSVNLYQKLSVNSRRQAVARAQALGLLQAAM